MKPARSDVRDTFKLEGEDEALLSVICEAEEPIGARLAARLMLGRGMSLSEASVSRAFTRLDSLGLSARSGRKGRVPTDLGRRLVEEQGEREKRDEVFDRALDLQTVEEILDWLKARQLLESQAAELAAVRATDEHVSELEETVQQHVANLADGWDPTPIGLHFHVVLMKASCSPIFIALIGSLYSPSLLRIERALDIILSDRGIMSDSVADHEQILAAIRDKDAESAGDAMSGHLMRLQAEAKRFADLAAAGNVPDLLRIINAVRSS